MILLARHLTLLLWFSLIPGLALAFWILPWVSSLLPNHDLPAAITIIGMVLVLIEWAMTRVGERRVLSALRSAESWDRAGITPRSEQQHLKALEHYERGLISPLRTRRIESVLLASLAKFSLTSAPSHPEFQRAVRTFLRISPQDGEIASLWLKRMSRSKKLSRQDHETITLVAEAHLDNPETIALCARLFLASGRTDYAARKVYRAVQSSSSPDQVTLADIGELMEPEDLTDTKANGMADDMPDILAENLAAPQPDVMFSDTLTNTEPETLGSRFSPRPFPEQGMKSVGRFKAIANKVKKNATAIPGVFQIITARLKAYHAFFQGRESLTRFLKWATALAAAAVLTGFGINTLVHLIHTPPKKTTVELNKIDKVEKVEKEMPGRFTIQVAAYLKKAHADEFLAKLKQKGLDAYIYRADGGGRTWFIVRISHFPDRESAAEYGANLKEQGLIDDFFVDNNE